MGGDLIALDQIKGEIPKSMVCVKVEPGIKKNFYYIKADTPEHLNNGIKAIMKLNQTKKTIKTEGKTFNNFNHGCFFFLLVH